MFILHSTWCHSSNDLNGLLWVIRKSTSRIGGDLLVCNIYVIIYIYIYTFWYSDVTNWEIPALAMEVAGKIIELAMGWSLRTFFSSVCESTGEVNPHSPRPTLWRETSKWRFHRIHGICSDMQLKLRANMPTERRRHDASLLRKKKKTQHPL